MINTVQQDLFRITGRKTSTFCVAKNLYNPEFLFLIIFRYTSHFYQNNSRIRLFLFRILLRHFSIKYGYEIPYQTNIEGGIKLIHRGGVIINPMAVIGKNATIFRGVTIGSSRRGRHVGAPVIGSNVCICANAAVIGKVSIGDYVMIAPNAYVNFDVPSHSIVIGNPGKIIQRQNASECYIDNPI